MYFLPVNLVIIMEQLSNQNDSDHDYQDTKSHTMTRKYSSTQKLII